MTVPRMMSTDNTSAPTPTEVPRLEVTSVAFGGRGVARLDGKVYFVKDAIPGDIVRVRVTGDKGRYADAQIIEWIERSPRRGDSPCPYLSECGGCLWLQVDYATQSEWKRTFVENALQRIGKIPADVTIQASPSPVTLGYRNRVHLKVAAAPGQPLRLGYYRAGTHDLVAIHRCAIAADPINDAIARLTALLPPVEREHRFKLEIMELPVSSRRDTPESTLTVYPERGERDALAPLVAALGAIPGVAWAGFAMDTYQAPWLVYDEDQGIRYHTRPGAFLQVNRVHNRSARAVVREWTERLNPTRVLDLFCGNGNLSLGLAREGRHVEGVELARAAIEAARHSAESQGIPGTKFLAMECEHYLWTAARSGTRFDLVITDPPREGMYKEIIPLRKIAPPHIIYMSCDPATLARDLSALCKKDYVVRELRTFDFFPHTWHIESLVLLERSAG